MKTNFHVFVLGVVIFTLKTDDDNILVNIRDNDIGELKV